MVKPKTPAELAELLKLGKCCRCNNVAQIEHTCPYSEDIHGDSDSLCNCCIDCEGQCAWDI